MYKDRIGQKKNRIENSGVSHTEGDTKEGNYVGTTKRSD